MIDFLTDAEIIKIKRSCCHFPRYKFESIKKKFYWNSPQTIAIHHWVIFLIYLKKYKIYKLKSKAIIKQFYRYYRRKFWCQQNFFSNIFFYCCLFNQPQTIAVSFFLNIRLKRIFRFMGCDWSFFLQKFFEYF